MFGLDSIPPSYQTMNNTFVEQEANFEIVVDYMSEVKGGISLFDNEEEFSVHALGKKYPIENEEVKEALNNLKELGFNTISTSDGITVRFTKWNTMDDSRGIVYSQGGEPFGLIVENGASVNYYTKVKEIKGNVWFYYEHIGE